MKDIKRGWRTHLHLGQSLRWILVALVVLAALYSCSPAPLTPPMSTFTVKSTATVINPTDTPTAYPNTLTPPIPTPTVKSAVTVISSTDTPTAYINALNRPADPVIMTGADVHWLTGITPNELVAWRYEEVSSTAGTWRQIPVQVDERAEVEMGRITKENLSKEERGRSRALQYTDPDTLTGPDPDTSLDADDEIVFMARDAGQKAPAGVPEPEGVIPNSGIEVAVSDSLDGEIGYVYLFRQDGTLDPSAGQSYVDYHFKLLSGDYLTTYQFEQGFNPEDSIITTSYYSVHFSDRWVDDELHILTAGSSGVDILDRHKTRLAPDNCTRTENTFSKWGGGFVVNKSGPVRAIRSYMGANSGRFTQRTHLFYEQRQDIISTMRVHELPGLIDLFDYSPEAVGMVYSNNLNPSGVMIDGIPDQVISGPLEWELVAGLQGGLVIIHKIETDIPKLSSTSYYLDDANPRASRIVQCTGDKHAYGTSGPWWNSPLPNTDPVMNPKASLLMTSRILYYQSPGISVSEAKAFNAAVRTPLRIFAQPWPNPNP